MLSSPLSVIQTNGFNKHRMQFQEFTGVMRDRKPQNSVVLISYLCKPLGRGEGRWRWAWDSFPKQAGIRQGPRAPFTGHIQLHTLQIQYSSEGKLRLHTLGYQGSLQLGQPASALGYRALCSSGVEAVCILVPGLPALGYGGAGDACAPPCTRKPELRAPR